MEQSLVINIADPRDVTAPIDILIEQEEWDVDSAFGARVSRAQIADFIKVLMFGGAVNTTLGNCGVDADTSDVHTAVRVYPRLGVEPVTTKISYGILAEPTTNIDEVTEVVNVSLADKFTVKYPVYDSLSLLAVGDVYDKYGNVTTKPDTLVTAESIRLSKKVYGSFKVSYKTKYLRYEITLPKRDDVENVYSSVVYAVYHNGVSWLKLSAPPGVEDTAGNDAGCGYHIEASDTPGGCNPIASPVHKTVRVDYCSQEIIDVSV